jgi:hypothetical protein
VASACHSGEHSSPDATTGSETELPRRALSIGAQHVIGAVPRPFRASGGDYASGGATYEVVVRGGAAEVAPYTFAGQARTAHGSIAIETVAVAVGSTSIAGSPSTALVNGAVIVQRGAAVEQLTGEPEGLHQAWSFAASPGEGDLSVEIAIRGASYRASTDGGLHFAIDDGVGVAYSHATWIAADGRRWAIPAIYDATNDRIRLTVPSRVISLTRFPARLDPVVSAEVAPDSPVVAPTGQTQQQGAIAYGAGEYLAVWSDNRTDSSYADIWGTRLDSTGTVIDTVGIRIAATSGIQSRPAVGFDGTAFVVAWEDFLAPGGTVSNIAVARVAVDGTVTSLGHVTAAAGSQTTPNVASPGAGTALVIWNTTGEVDGAIVSSAIAPTFAIATGALVERPSIASAATGDYLVGYTASNHLMGQLVSTAGALDGAAITISAPASGAQSQSDATFDGTNYDIVWRNGADAKVYGTAVSTAGTVLETRTVSGVLVGGVALNAAPAISYAPSIACEASGCFVAWQDQRNISTTSYDLYGQLVTSAFAKSGAELALSTASGPQVNPRVASNGSGFFLEWTDNRNDSVNQSYGATVSSAGGVGAATDIGTGNNRESWLAIGAAAGDSALFWRDSRGGPSIYTVGYDASGAALEASSQAVAPSAGAQATPAASSDLGGHTLVVWQDTRNGVNNDIYGARVDVTTGTTLDSSGIAISTATSDQLVPSIASNGTVALAVWQDLRNGNFDVYGALIDSTGAVTVNDIAVSVATGAQDNPAVTWDAASSQFLVIWQDSRSGTFQIMGTRVDASGTVLDPAGVAVVASTSGQDSPAIASTSSSSLAVWRDGTHVRGARMSGGSALTIVDAGGLAVSTTSSQQTGPKVGVLAGAFLAVWSDNRAGNQDIYGQIIAVDGTLQGGDFGISTSPDDEVLPRVAAIDASNARVAYEARRLDTSRAETRVVGNALESIAVTPVSASIAKGLTQAFVATATYSDGSTADVTASATWASSATTVATMSGNVATGVGLGTSTISATVGAVTGSATLTVTAPTLVSIGVSPTLPSIAKGTTLAFTATGTYTDASTVDLTSSVTWASSATAVATISAGGVATGVSAGTTTISATLGALGDSTTLTVTAATLVSMVVAPVTPSIASGTSVSFTATGTYSDGTTQDLTTQVAWSSSKPTVATISAAGLATGIAAGTTTIAASLGAIGDSTVLTVTSATLTSIQVTPVNPSIAKSTTQQFTATGTYNDGTTQDLTTQVAWSSSATAVATIAATGLATGVAAGTTTIAATLSGITGSTTLTVTSATLTSITVTPANAHVALTYYLQYTATGTFSDGTTQNLTSLVTWSSSQTTVAKISNAIGASHGRATVVGLGTTTITATYIGVSGSTTLVGTNATLVSIAVTPPSMTLHRHNKQQLTATGTFSDGTTLDLTTQVSWKSTSNKNANVNATGTVSANKVGTATITATKSGRTGSAAVTVIN